MLKVIRAVLLLLLRLARPRPLSLLWVFRGLLELSCRDFNLASVVVVVVVVVVCDYRCGKGERLKGG